MDTINTKYPIIGTGYKTLSKIKDGNMALGLNLSNDTHIVPCFIDENNIEQSNYRGAETYVSLQLGNHTINPTELKYDIETNYVEGTWNPVTARYVVTKLLDDCGYVDFKTTYKGETHEARFSISKVFNGDDNYLLDIGDNNHIFSSNSEGNINKEVIVDIDILLYKGVTRITPERISVPKDQPGMTLTVKENSIQMKVMTGKDLALAGWFDITVWIHGKTFKKEFRWIKTRDGEKGDQGDTGPVGPVGPTGPTGYVPDWVKDWDYKQGTMINGQKVVTGSFFAGKGGSPLSGIAIGVKAISSSEDGLSVFSNGNQIINFYTNPKTVNSQANTIASFGTGDNAMTVSTGGLVKIPAATISGKLTAGQIDVDNLYVAGAASFSGQITANQVVGGTLTSANGVKIIKLENGYLNYFHGSKNCGYMGYNSDGSTDLGDAKDRMLIESTEGYVLKLKSSGNMSLEAAAGKKVYINNAFIKTLEIGTQHVGNVVARFG